MDDSIKLPGDISSDSSVLAAKTTVQLSNPPWSLNDKSFKFGILAMESEKYISIKSPGTQTPHALVVDLDDPTNPQKISTKKAEAAIMHPRLNIIALRAKAEDKQQVVVLYRLPEREQIAEEKFDEEIYCWKWINNEYLAIITSTSVYHWGVLANPPTSAQQIFERSGKLHSASTQIINYRVDHTMEWCLLCGISSTDGKNIEGHLQLYNIAKKQQQFLDGHSGTFGSIIVENQKSLPVFGFCERKPGELTTKLHIMDVYSPRGESLPPPFKAVCELTFPSESLNDFPVGIHISSTFGFIFVITKSGLCFLVNGPSGTVLMRNRISNETIFATATNQKTGCVIAVTRKGQVLNIDVNEKEIIPHIRSNLAHVMNQSEIIGGLVRNYGISGADDLLISQFNQLFSNKDYKGAAKVAAIMKSGALRTPQTIQKFKDVAVGPGQPSAALVYFSALLEKGSLNALEAIELVRPVVAQNRKELLQAWLEEDKLECTEQLGDLVKAMDIDSALRIYKKAHSHSKVVSLLNEKGNIEEAISYAKIHNYQANYGNILRSLILSNPEKAVSLVSKLLDNPVPLVDVNQVVEIFLSNSKFAEITSVLIDFLKANKPEHSALQTKVLEINLIHNPAAAETIFQMDLLSHYEKLHIAKLCEKAQLYTRALENYTDLVDIKRVLAASNGGINPEFISTFMKKNLMSSEACLEIFTEIVRSKRQNVQMIVSIANNLHERAGADNIVKVLETFNSWECIFYFLGSIVNSSTDPDVHFKYIHASCKLGQMSEVERIVKESKVYDAVAVKEYLMNAELSDSRPLIHVCNIHGFIEELTGYFYKHGLMKYIEVYVIKVNPQATPRVVGSLIDLDCPEEFIVNLLHNVRASCPAKALTTIMEQKKRLRLLQPWLEARGNEGSQDVDVNNALAKLAIETGNDPESFLKSNPFYDPKEIGKFCEEREVHLSCLAYQKGKCDQELLQIASKNGLYRLLAKYLVERQSEDLWAQVLDPNYEGRNQIIDQVVSTALPDATVAEEVLVTVKSFMKANLPNALIELLEKIVLYKSEFNGNRSLQNLLILTAVKAQSKRTVDFLSRLDNYDGPEIAKATIEYGLYEGALLIYKKFEMHEEAMNLLVTHIKDLTRALDLAEKVRSPNLWRILSLAFLDENDATKSIDAALRAEDPVDANRIINVANKTNCQDSLIKYLKISRKWPSMKNNSIVDSELLYCLANGGHETEALEFLKAPNAAAVENVGSRLFTEENYEAAKVVFSSIPLNTKVAACLVKLGRHEEAIQVATLANSPKTWKDICFTCIENGDFELAQKAALCLVTHSDHVEDLVMAYEKVARFDELIALLEASVSEGKAPVPIYTELGVVYAKYKPEKIDGFMELPMVVQCRINMGKLIRTCERHELWHAAAHLHYLYSEFDQAINILLSHPTEYGTPEKIIEFSKNSTNQELHRKVVTFFVNNYPASLNKLLITVQDKIDHSRTLAHLRSLDALVLAVEYLETIQSLNISSVNETLNQIYLEKEDYDKLRSSVTKFSQIDGLDLAAKLRDHELLEMRRISCLLYKVNKSNNKALQLSLKDNMLDDAIEIAIDSQDPKVAQTLLDHFVKNDLKTEFATCLATCFDLLGADVVLEHSWKKGWTDLVMPFMIQTLRNFNTKISELEKRTEKLDEKEKPSYTNTGPTDFGQGIESSSVQLNGLGGFALTMSPHQENEGHFNL